MALIIFNYLIYRKQANRNSIIPRLDAIIWLSQKRQAFFVGFSFWADFFNGASSNAPISRTSLNPNMAKVSTLPEENEDIVSPVTIF